MRAVIYARYSSDNQRSESIDAQVNAIEVFAKQNKLKIVNKYIDEAKSATSDNRPAFQRMIADSKKGLFDYIIVHKLDRFSRDRYDSAIYKKKLKDNKVRLLSVVERLDDSPESILLESLIEGMSEYYSKNLAREVMKGLMENAKSCRHTGGKPPFGFDVDRDKNYIINDHEAVAVKKIFELYSTNYSYPEIILWLDNNKYKTKYNKPFTRTSLNTLLQNEKYIGTYIYKRTTQTKFNGIRVDVVNDENDMIRIEDGIPAIVDKGTFDIVQEKMNENKLAQKSKRNTTAKQNYLLSGVLFCGECGSPMTGKSSRNGRNKALHVTYTCSKRKKTGECSKKDVNKERFENEVLTYLNDKVFTDKFISSLTNKIHEVYLKKKSNADYELSGLRSELKDVEKQLDNIFNALATTGIVSKGIQDRLQDLENKKEHIVSEIDMFNARNSYTFDIEKIKEFLQIGKGLKDKSVEEQQLIIRTFVEKIIVTEINEEDICDMTVRYGDEGS